MRRSRQDPAEALAAARERARQVAAGLLARLSRGLSATARAAERAARRLETRVEPPPTAPSTTAERVAATYAERGAVTHPSARRTATEPRTPAPEARQPTSGAQVRVSALAGENAREVIARLGALSPEELRLLAEHERANKNRKTVLEAIEKAVGG